jgi:hypothetical protein
MMARRRINVVDDNSCVVIDIFIQVNMIHR